MIDQIEQDAALPRQPNAALAERVLDAGGRHMSKDTESGRVKSFDGGLVYRLRHQTMNANSIVTSVSDAPR